MNAWRTIIACLLMALALPACKDRSESRNAPARASSSTAQTAGRCEHGLPQALCPKCTPALAAVYQARGDWCAEHGFPESFCPICNPGRRSRMWAQRPPLSQIGAPDTACPSPGAPSATPS